MGSEIMAERRKIDNDMSDNTGMVYFPDCKGCVFAAHGNKITPGYTKSVCDVYPKLKRSRRIKNLTPDFGPGSFFVSIAFFLTFPVYVIIGSPPRMRGIPYL